MQTIEIWVLDGEWQRIDTWLYWFEENGMKSLEEPYALGGPYPIIIRVDGAVVYRNSFAEKLAVQPKLPEIPRPV